MRGKGVPKMGSFSGSFCLVLWCPDLLVLFCFKNLKTYGFDFGFLSFVVWISVGESLWTSWASRDILERPLLSKIVKNSLFLMFFLRMLLWGVLMPLMVVLSHLLLSLAGFHPPWLPKWDSKRFQTVIKN